MQNRQFSEMQNTQMQNEVVLYCTGELPDNSPYWAYIKVQPSRISNLGKAQQSGDFNLMDYGEILQYGFEEHAPKDIRDKMTIEHSVNHNFADQLRSIVHKQ